MKLAVLNIYCCLSSLQTLNNTKKQKAKKEMWKNDCVFWQSSKTNNIQQKTDSKKEKKINDRKKLSHIFKTYVI